MSLNRISFISGAPKSMQDSGRQAGVPVPDKPEHKPQKQREEPTRPSPDIPERVPQRPREAPTIPSPDIPEQKPLKTSSLNRLSLVNLRKE